MFIVFEGEFAFRDTLRFIENTRDLGLWSYNIVSDKMCWSAGAYRLLGFEPSAVQPSMPLFLSRIHEEDKLSYDEFQAVIRQGMPVDRDVRFIAQNGQTRWVHIHTEVLFDKKGHPATLIGIGIDVTKRKEALRAAELSYRRFRTIAESVSSVIWMTKIDGTVIDNSGWLQLTGMAGEEWTAQGFGQVIHPDEREVTLAAWAEALRSGKAFTKFARVRMADNNYRWFSLRAAPITGPNGELAEWIGIGVDIDMQMAKTTDQPSELISGVQVRAARGMVCWSVRDLEEASGVSAAIIRRIESFNGISETVGTALPKIKTALHDAGADFILSNGQPGVRTRRKAA